MELVRRALSVGEDVASALAERSGGNAFYLEELIRHVARLGMPSAGDPLPQTVLAMVEARLGALEPEARRVLRAASVFGQVFYRRGVMALNRRGTTRPRGATERARRIRPRPCRGPGGSRARSGRASTPSSRRSRCAS